MKRNYLLILLIALSFGCKKSVNNLVTEPEIPKNQVMINGNIFTTVEIGTQTWTNVGYYGSTGSGVFADKISWKYQRAQMKNITIPAGWRIPSKADVEKLFRTAGVTTGFVPLTETYYNDLQPNPGTKTDNGTQLKMDNAIAVKFLSGSDWTNATLNNSIGFNATVLNNQTSEWWCSDDGLCTFIFSTNATDKATGQIKHLPNIDITGSKYLYKTCGVRFVKDK